MKGNPNESAQRAQYRNYREEHLAVRRLKRKHAVRPTAPVEPHQGESRVVDVFRVEDGLATGLNRVSGETA
jgi:hypothetical protein